MNKFVFLVVFLVAQISFAGDLGVFTDNTGYNGSEDIRVYATDTKLIITAYYSTWEYTKKNPSSSVYLGVKPGTSAEYLGDDAVLWKEFLSINLETRNLIRIKVCQ